MYDPFLNFGCIVSFLFGNYLSGIDQAKVSLIVPCISGVILFLLPESPEYLAKRGSENVCKWKSMSSFFNEISNIFVFI